MNTETVHKDILFPNVKVGDTFKIGGYEFIRFPEVDGKIPAVMKDIAFRSAFGGNNDLRYSDVLREMKGKILPKIIAAVGEENVCTFTTDLTTLDGLKPYEPQEERISLLTLDFYRSHVEIFDKYKLEEWWWLATPDSACPHDDPYWILCVSPSGYIDNYFCRNRGNGVRPFCIFNPSIFESSEE